MNKDLKERKSVTVLHYLEKILETEDFSAGSRFPSENKLASELGVSKNTVREAISALVREGRLYRVKGSGTFVCDYAPVLSQDSKTAILLAADPFNAGHADHFISSLLLGLHSILDDEGWNVRLKTFSPLSNMADEIKEYLEELSSEAAIVTAGFDVSSNLAEILLNTKRKVLSIGRSESGAISYIHTDHTTGMKLTLDKLLAMGHKKIALVDQSSSHLVSYMERKEAFINGLSENGIIPDARLIVDYEDLTSPDMGKVLQTLKNRNVEFTAAIIYGYETSMLFRRELELSGRLVPRDVSLVSFSSIPIEGITTLTWSISDMAVQAAKLLLSDLDLPPVSITEPLLINEDASVNLH